MPLKDLLAGGFLRGKRTYVLAWAGAAAELLSLLAHWAIGDPAVADSFEKFAMMLVGLAVAAMRAGLESQTRAVLTALPTTVTPEQAAKIEGILHREIQSLTEQPVTAQSAQLVANKVMAQLVSQ